MHAESSTETKNYVKKEKKKEEEEKKYTYVSCDIYHVLHLGVYNCAQMFQPFQDLNQIFHEILLNTNRFTSFMTKSFMGKM